MDSLPRLREPLWPQAALRFLDWTRSVKVLIADFDLFSVVGGGQTFYRRLIATHPDISFSYFRCTEPANAQRPQNATAIPYRELYSEDGLWKALRAIDPPQWLYADFARASNVAAAVAGQEFDVVEVPDYEQFGVFLGAALKHHRLSYDRLVLSLHGCISTTIRLNWGGAQFGETKEIELREELQYRVVDLRYGISNSYLNEWRAHVDMESHYLSPLWFMPSPEPRPAQPSENPPSLNFIGRPEKRKGPDIFVDIAWWLPRSVFGECRIIGPESYDPNGKGSSLYLYTMVNNRGLDVTVQPAISEAELRALMATRAVTVLPSRYDPLNLVAIESVFAGCPTVIGSGAGAAEFLRATFPGLPLVIVDTRNMFTALPQIRQVLEQYDEYRERVVSAVEEGRPSPQGPDLQKIYSSAPAGDATAKDQAERWYGQLAAAADGSLPRIARRARSVRRRVVGALPPLARQRIRVARQHLGPRKLSRALIEKFLFTPRGAHGQLAHEVAKTHVLARRYEQVFHAPERTEKQRARKLEMCWETASEFRVDRVGIWREIARLERLRGNDVMAATYYLRAMRALGEDAFGDLEFVVLALEAGGYGKEAAVVRPMFGSLEMRHESCIALLDAAASANRENPVRAFELVDDRRRSEAYKASLIVSLHNVGEKLAPFLAALENQTLLRRHAAELILVDSGSNAEEYERFLYLREPLDVPVVYARSPDRETIQTAWNRGLSLSRSPYVCFLGVDEALVPDALEVLVGVLERNTGVDWVQANSIVTRVDSAGSWIEDVMVYDRNGYRQDLVYLETCYLSWVGALYRRSIHERFGYYDESFRAAGDTEFKNRVLPFIRSTALPRTLGIFWNYPDDRSTQSPRAEIEDLRAWYLHRCPAGVRWAFRNRQPSDAEDLFFESLRYRKSFCRHWSTDVEYALALAAYAVEVEPTTRVSEYIPGLEGVLARYREVDRLDGISRLSAPRVVARAWRVASEVARAQRALSGGGVDPAYEVFNDNRYEQHTHVWRTDLEVSSDSKAGEGEKQWRFHGDRTASVGQPAWDRDDAQEEQSESPSTPVEQVRGEEDTRATHP